MNRELIYDALLQPEKLKMIPRAELERVAAEYPYFNPAQVLLARIYQNDGDHRFSDQLLSASNTSGDRVSLYHYLKQSGPEQEIVSTLTIEPLVSPIQAEISPETPVTPAAELREETPAQTLAVPVEESKPTPAAVVAEPKAEPKTEHLAAAAVPEQEVEEVNETDLPEDLLNREVLLRAVFSTIEQDVIEDLKETRSASAEEEEADAPASGSVVRAVREETPGDEADESSDPFARYLIRRAREIGYEKDENLRRDEDSVRYSEQEDDTEEESADEESDYGATEATAGISRVAGPPLGLSGSRKRSQQELIDRFIQTNPKITPGRTDDYDVDSIARTSVTDDLSFVSETMAELLASQGKKEKAKKVYRKLMELHPEKSIYFAARLKNLDKLK
ncbi:MAG: hypothetical protein RL220_714 [Bacteroidota bacterium]